MSTKVLDVSSLKIVVPILKDEDSLRRQFSDRTVGNNENLDEAYALPPYPTAYHLSVEMVLVETTSWIGSSSKSLTSSACEAIGKPVTALVNPSLAQVGALSSMFREEEDVLRTIPLVQDKKVICLVWKRANWPTRKQPVFRFHDKDPIHGSVWVMLPFLYHNKVNAD